MKIVYNRDGRELRIDDLVFRMTNEVRNEIDPRNVRRLHEAKEVRYTVNADRTKGVPYMPRKFPKGMWRVKAVEWQRVAGFSLAEFGELRITTDAWQEVEEWALDATGGYDKPTGRKVKDYGYHMHYTDSRTTLGCGRFETQQQCLRVGMMVSQAIEKTSVYIEVI